MVFSKELVIAVEQAGNLREERDTATGSCESMKVKLEGFIRKSTEQLRENVELKEAEAALAGQLKSLKVEVEARGKEADVCRKEVAELKADVGKKNKELKKKVSFLKK